MYTIKYPHLTRDAIWENDKTQGIITHNNHKDRFLEQEDILSNRTKKKPREREANK